MSNINAGAIDGNYPTAGVNNSSQGLRDNFTSIKTNLTTAGTEITDLQSKVLVKSALNGITLDNDMSGGRISNVETLGFRASTYNLGTNLSGTVTVDCTLGDVHYGEIDAIAGAAGAILLSFTKWAPADTRGQVEVILTVQPGQVIGIPQNGDGSIPYGADTLEGYQLIGDNPQVKVPAGVTRVHYIFGTIDCGSTLEIMPVDRPRQTTQIKWGVPETPLTITVSGTIGTTTLTTTSNFATALNGTTLNTRTLVTTDNVVLGTVTAVASSNTSLTLSTPLTSTLTNASIKAYSSYGRTGDQKGDVMVNTNSTTNVTYLYICTADWVSPSTTNIWSRTVLTAPSTW